MPSTTIIKPSPEQPIAMKFHRTAFLNWAFISSLLSLSFFACQMRPIVYKRKPSPKHVTMTPSINSQFIIFPTKCNLYIVAKGDRLCKSKTADNRQLMILLMEPQMSDLDSSYRVTSDELRQFIERIERLDSEKKDLMEQQKEVMAEAKGRGYDTKIMRRLIGMRRRDQADVAEEEAILDMYRQALGM